MTDKNIIKNWFKTGLKPLQAHFWAWLDSYWHKDELIPQNKVEGLDNTLSNKAEVTALNAKANADSSGLTTDNIISWKKALGVGEVPDNMATIDKDGKLGNVYDKTQVDNLLENSGKNIGNSDLTIPSGTIRVLDLRDSKLIFKGLEDKTQDKSYNLRPRMNANGELVFSREADINLIMPMEANIAVHHIFPSVLPQNQEWAEEIKEIMRNYSTYAFTPFTKEDFVENQDDITNDGMLTTISNDIVNSSKKLPNDRDWIIKIEALRSVGFIGISQTKGKILDIGFTLVGEWQTDMGGFSVYKGNVRLGGINQFDGVGIIIKKGNLIISIGYSNSATDVRIVNGNLDFGEYMISARRFSGKISYKFLN